MEAVIFVGLQASGKSSFFRDRFFRTHVRLNLDMLKTRRRQALLLQACLEGKTRFVLENTNLTRAERAACIGPARGAGFKIIGYVFKSSVAEALQRNQLRPEAERVPKVAIFTANKRLQPPQWEEGFDELWEVRMIEGSSFEVTFVPRPYLIDQSSSGLDIKAPIRASNLPAAPPSSTR